MSRTPTSSTEFQRGFEKRANSWSHAAEGTGLAMLAAAPVSRLLGHEVSKKTDDKLDVAGLTVLGLPTAAHFGSKLLTKGKA